MNTTRPTKLYPGDQVVLVDASQQEHTYTIITAVPVSGKTYAVLMAPNVLVAPTFTIMRCARDQSGKDCLIPVTSEAEIGAVKAELEKGR